MNSNSTFLVGVLLAVGGSALAGGVFMLKGERSTPENAVTHLKEYRLIDVMHELQTHSTKLYFAGIAENGELASWYNWKIQQSLSNIKEGRTEPYAYNGWDAIELATMLDIPIKEIDEVIDSGQWSRFEDAYDFLMDTCNACHAATEHSFVVVRAPRGQAAPLNQKFDIEN